MSAQRLMALFAGNPNLHGTHGEPDQEPGSLKWGIKRTARTLKEPVTLELWERHLAGDRPLGIIPIQDDSTCWWGSIDVDQYDTDLLSMVSKVESGELPLVPCRSKSGGLHLFMFLEEPQPAALVQSVLRYLAAGLGLADSEIFPKQTQVLAQRGDQGNWMVMPYFGGDFGGKLRQQVGLRKTGAELTLEEFCKKAEKLRVPPDQLAQLSQRRARKTGGKKLNGAGGPFSDGPPCLQHMAASGFPEGGRNNALFMMGLYYKRVNPSGWTEAVEEANRQFMKPPLTADEVALTLRSLEKKDYDYTCKSEPMVGHCDAIICRGRQFGVGRGVQYPILSGITKLDIKPEPIWFVDVAGQRIELDTNTLHTYPLFQKTCLRTLNVVFQSMKQNDWLQLLSVAMEGHTVLQPPPDVGDDETFRELLEEFLTNRARGQRREDLFQGKPWEDDEAPEGPRHYFRLRDLVKFLSKEGLKDVRRGDVIRKIERLGGGSHFFNLRQRGLNVWWVPSNIVRSPPEPDLPPRKEHPI